MARSVGFTDPDAWTGGYYELTMCYPAGAVDLAAAAVQSLWRLDALTGCYAERDIEPDQQQSLAPEEVCGEHGDACGVCSLPTGDSVPCRIFRVDLDDDGVWVSLALPLGSLEKTDERIGGFPFGSVEGSWTWREPLERFLVDIGRQVYDQAPFRFAASAHEPEPDEFEAALAAGTLPGDRWDSLLLPIDGTLVYIPSSIR